ncbi:MAG: hypothetical protein MJ184_08395 [Treponema sp.]|uniref:hypothetical protein n=1 Tax=Treponema sp. TaxID=166 RepID=UPI00298D8269|nr:hypothetical protein [Treponema sp.]MCQ2601364.1 hypothetical protein [Treponema sp.]
MNLKKLLQKADFSKETDLKEQLLNRLLENEGGTELMDEELEMLNAAKGNTDFTDPLFNPSNQLLKDN